GLSPETTHEPGFKKESVAELFRRSATFDSDRPKDVHDLWSSATYPVNFKLPEEKEKEESIRIDPKNTSVVLFPGQGSQFVGMGNDLLQYPNVKKMYERASEILKYDLERMCLEGPRQDLNQTVHCQAAVVVTSLAAVERLRALQPWAIENCVAAAGFSVGEYAALVFSQALSFEDGKVLHLSVSILTSQWTSRHHSQGRKIICYLRTSCSWTVVKNWGVGIVHRLSEAILCVSDFRQLPQFWGVACNSPALQFVELNARDLGIKRYKRLSVSGAFHTPLMRPAQKPLARALQAVHLAPPRIMTHSNLDGAAYTHPEEIRRKLEAQLVMPVKWEQLMQQVYNRDVGEEFPRTFECGPGTSLRAVLKMVNGKAWNVSESIGA
ncbi:malonyl CoA-acyl carrier protein transacylase, putative, partial [Ixodes scapularis]